MSINHQKFFENNYHHHLSLEQFKIHWCSNPQNIKIQWQIKLLKVASLIWISTLNFEEKFAKFRKQSMFFKPLITPEPRIGKFQNWAEIKVNYSTDKENTQMDFSDNFHNIQNFVQVEQLGKILKNRLMFSLFRFQKNTGVRKNFPITKIKHI